ncbi:hypothetical protein ACO2RV_24890 [Ancylobacter sp. VNQ12]|uniref:hypothetical protein n=1 Tax=Ancylobacter sp. VNQ12 TaxID=3400920 RepID=UPI003C1058E2
MKWPEEAQEQEARRDRYYREFGASVAEYLEKAWRPKASAIVKRRIEEAISNNSERAERATSYREDVIHWLQSASGLHKAAEELSADEDTDGVSLRGALLVEAALAIFCIRPSVARWKLVGNIVDNDPVAIRVLIYLIRRRVEQRPNLRHSIRRIASTLVRDYVANPAGSRGQRDRIVMHEAQQRWQANPELNEIWFGLRTIQNVFPFRSDWFIFDVLIEIDTEFAAQLLEEYRAPYQPTMILDRSLHDPGRRFSTWERLMQYALPAFDVEGAWNGRLLLPMLLYVVQDNLRRGLPRPATRLGDSDPEQELWQLSRAVASAIWRREDGAACALRWGGWLFRSVMSSVDGERIPFPADLTSRGRSDWRVIEALIEPEATETWTKLNPKDVPADSELCIEAMRILAAQKHKRRGPEYGLILESLPSEPEQFLDDQLGQRMRELPSLFVIWGKRPDAFGNRVIAHALLAPTPASTFHKLWKKTQTLREMTEHLYAYRNEDFGHDDRARRASDTIRFVISLGINLLDLLQNPDLQIDIESRRNETLSILQTLHDATREMLAIDPIGRASTENLHDHLCVRRMVYEETHGAGGTLRDTDEPTSGALLANRVETTRAFFGCLSMLIANGISRDRISKSLATIDVDLESFIARAQSLNAIEDKRAIDLRNFD